MTDANTTPSSLEFQEPSDEEARHYYVSFSTRPRQLGRTSSATKPWFFETWPPPDAHYPWGRGRELPGATAAGPVGNHRIHATWEVTTAQKVLEAICPLDWTCIDVLRIGRQADDEKDRPVIVWVGASSKSVICGETSWRLVKGVLERVRRAFDSDNLFNVECEVRQSDVHSSVSVGELGQGQGQDEGEIESKLRLLPLLHGHYQDRQRPVEIRPTQLISTSIGQAIVPNCSPGNVGSLGMYLMPADDNSDVVWALTARHVIVPDEFTKDGKSVPLPDIKVLLPPPETVKETRKQVEDIVRKTASEAGKDTYGNMWVTHLARQQALLNQFRAREASPERCAIGTVQYAPDIRLNTLKTVPSYTRDWALISLDKKSFPFDFGFENVVDLRRHGDEEDHFLKEVKRALGEVSSQSSQAAQYSFPPERLLRLRGVIPVAEMKGRRISQEWTRTTDDIKHMVVVNAGQASGVTAGVALDVRSITRRYDRKTRIGAPSYEWAIIHADATTKRLKTNSVWPAAIPPFTMQKDSGSVVVDLEGRVGGLVTGGSAKDEAVQFSYDVTYATPMEYIVKDIEEETGCRVKIP